MKTSLAALLLVLATGCAYNYPYSHSTIGAQAPPPEMPTSQYTVINNSGYKLMVYQDGKYIGDLPLGGVLPVKGTLLWRSTIVTVTALDANGAFVGSDSWKYAFGVPEAWTVLSLNAPRRPR